MGKPIIRHINNSSTSNLTKHAKTCNPAFVAASLSRNLSITDFVAGCTYRHEDFRFLISTWIMKNHRAYTIIEDKELWKVFKMLYGRVEIPSRRTVIRDAAMLFTLSCEKLIAKLKVSRYNNLSINHSLTSI